MDTRRSLSRTGTTPALVAAVALAMISLAVAGSQPAMGGIRGVDPRSTIAESDTARLMAAAVAAARTLLGADQASQAMIHSAPQLAGACNGTAAVLPHSVEICFATGALRVEVIDLPPPTC